jgi:hypothetical protein
MNKDFYEPVESSIAQQELSNKHMKITGLKKTYDNGVTAVENINLKLYTD